MKTNILIICEGYMACLKGTTRGINPTPYTSLRLWEASYAREIEPYTVLLSFIKINRPPSHKNVFYWFWNYWLNVLDYITVIVLLKIMCALANVHHIGAMRRSALNINTQWQTCTCTLLAAFCFQLLGCFTNTTQLKDL